METVYDWVTLSIFAALIVLFLQRSVGNQKDDAPLAYYLAAGLGCAVANYFGNEEQHLIAVVILAATIGLIFRFLKPFQAANGA